MKLKIMIAFFLWNHLSEGNSPFYRSPQLHRYKAHNPPNPSHWNGYKLLIWNKAVDYLVMKKKLSYTPSLRESF